MAMTPKEIHQALAGICSTFPKSSKTFVGFIDHASKTGAMEGTMQHAGVISMKNAWQLENKAPTVSFAPTDEKLLDYVRNVCANAAQSAVKMLVVIDLPANLTSVYVLPKGACFLATAAYGSPLAEEIVTLSRFRDEILMRSRLGAGLVRLYYAVSPPLASFIAEWKGLRVVTRSTLVPIVWAVKLAVRRSRRSVAGEEWRGGSGCY